MNSLWIFGLSSISTMPRLHWKLDQSFPVTWKLLHFLFPSLLRPPCCSHLTSMRLPPCLCPRPLVPLFPSLLQPCPCPSDLIPLSLDPFLPYPLLLQHSWTPHSLDLWIFPGSSLDLPCLPWTPISGSFLVSLLLLLLVHLLLCTLASLSPCVPLSHFYLSFSYHHWLPLLTNSLFLCHHHLSYSLNSTMTYSPWLIASFRFVYKSLAQPMYSLSYSYTVSLGLVTTQTRLKPMSMLVPSPIHLVILELCLFHSSTRTVASDQSQLASQPVFPKTFSITPSFH